MVSSEKILNDILRSIDLETDERISAVKERARKNFSKGYNCAECIIEAVLKNIDTGLPEQAQKIATGFGGGIGLYGDTCGAITGAVIAVGAVHGRSGLPEGEDRKAVVRMASRELYGNPGLYRLFNRIPSMVEKKYGNTLCRNICKRWKNDWFSRARALLCREIVTDVAELAARLICSDKEKLISQPFGKKYPEF